MGPIPIMYYSWVPNNIVRTRILTFSSFILEMIDLVMAVKLKS